VRREIEVAGVALMLLGYAHAQPADDARRTDDSLRIYAAGIWQDRPNRGDPDAAYIWARA
jgi:hypothetical protein